MEKDKISIIIPVYQGERYLAECVESVLHQTYQNLEILLLDDGSTDKSGRICDELGKKDPRIRVFHQENHGVSYTRNFGLEQISGAYIFFIDADDFIRPDCMEKLYQHLDKTDKTAISMCEFDLLCGEKTQRKKEPLIGYSQKTDTLFKALLNSLILRKIHGSACRALYPAAMIQENHIRFTPCKIAEDLLFLVEVLVHCTKVSVCHEPLYVYRQDMDSSSHRNYIQDYLMDRQLYFRKLANLLKMANLEQREYQWLMSYSFQFYRMLLYMNAASAPEPEKEIAEIDQSAFGREKVSVYDEKQFYRCLGKKQKILNKLVKCRMFSVIRTVRNAKRTGA